MRQEVWPPKRDQDVKILGGPARTRPVEVPVPAGPYRVSCRACRVYRSSTRPRGTLRDDCRVTEVQSPIAGGGGENCPSCGSPLAKDQRYCLACGARRGDPRLPFMDAVVFMDAIKQPSSGATAEEAREPAAPARRPLMSANASLVAGVATLVLAIGVGVLIGRSGDSGSSNASATPQIIRVGGGGGGGEVAEEATATTAGKSKSGGGSSGTKPSTATQKKAKEKTETGASGTSKATEEVFKPAKGVKLAPPDQKIGGKCEKGTAGCSENGTFDGSFFGE
ncbi:MAG: hypothetical protein ACM3NV_08390 [Syntrophothermus sp.]